MVSRNRVFAILGEHHNIKASLWLRECIKQLRLRIYTLLHKISGQYKFAIGVTTFFWKVDFTFLIKEGMLWNGSGCKAFFWRGRFFQGVDIPHPRRRKWRWWARVSLKDFLPASVQINEKSINEKSKWSFLLTSGWSLTGTNTFSVRVVTSPSGSGNISGSFLCPFTWNKFDRTLAISVNK